MMYRRIGLAALCAATAAAGCADRQRSSTADARLSFSGPVDFQRVAVYATREVRATLTNVGRSQLNVLELWVEDKDGAYRAGFGHEGEHRLIPGGSCEIVLAFHPRRQGGHPARLVVRSDSHAEPLFKVDLTGMGVDAVARLDQQRLDFGRIELGSKKVRGLRLHNPSDLAVTVTPRAVGRDKDEFEVAPVVLGPGEAREIDVQFTPTKVGKKLASLAVSPCEGCADHVVTLIAEGLDRAIVADPPELDFGQVPIDRDAVLEVTLTNISTEPQDVTGLDLSGATDPSFTHLSGEADVTLHGGESRTFAFRYSPGHMGAAEGEAVFTLGSRRNPTLGVPMFGFGGAPELCVSPLVLNFPELPVGAKVGEVVTVRNCGTSNAGPVTIDGVTVSASTSGVGGEDQFTVAPPALPISLAAGEELTFRVFYEPTRAGPAAARVGIRTSGFRGTVAGVEVRGSGFDHAPCVLEITPDAVDFGTVPPDGEGLLGIKVNNVGTDVCPVKNIELVDDAGGAFVMPGGELDGVIVHAGYYFSFMVGFRPPSTGGTFSGMLKIEQWDPANPVIRVPLVGNSQSSCLVAVPHYLDFGVTRPSCLPSPLVTTVSNACTTPVQVNGITVGPGTTDGEFVIASAPSTPMTLAPGAEVEVEVRYLAQHLGMNLSPLFVAAEGLSRPLLVSLVGEASKHGEATDRFVQQDGGKVDVLFVVDNTASMVEEHPRLVAAIPSFVDAARTRGVDLRVAVTTTGLEAASAACPGGAQGGEAGRFFPVDNARPRILTLGTSNLASVLQQNVQVGQCAFVEQGFEALKRALSAPLVSSADDPRTAAPNDGNLGFLRDSAALAVVFVGDEDDHSPDPVDAYVDWLRSVKGRGQPGRATLFAIAPSGQACSTAGGTGTRYAEAARRTGGDVLSICAPDYAPILQQVAGKAFSAQDAFPLSALPEPGSVTVSVDGAPLTSGWHYDSAANQVVFSPRPGAGAVIDVSYRRACGQ